MEEQDNNIIARYLKKDAEILKENVIPQGNDAEQGGGLPKSKYWKFVGWFFALILIALIGIPVVGQYMQKQEQKAKDEQIAEGIQYMNTLQERLKNDKDGGATPEETLKLFTATLKSGDMKQAEKYFVFEPQKKQDELIGLVQELQENGEMPKFIEHLQKTKLEATESIDFTAWLSYKNKNENINFSVQLKKPNFSTVWKIENIYP